MTTEAQTATAPRRRSRERGAAAIEFSISLILLVPLIFGMIDYGYYFYVSTTAAEAARFASRAVAVTTVGACTNAAGVTAAQTAGSLAATNYMNQIGLGSSTNLTTTIACQPAPPATLSPYWKVTVTVNFPPIIGIIKSLMKQSTTTTGWVAYTEEIFVLGK